MKRFTLFQKWMPLALLCLCSQAAWAGGPGTVPPGPFINKQEPLQSDIGEIYVSFVGERSLDEVIDDLQPVFPITPQSAFQMAVPDTRSTTESALSAFSGSAQIGITGASSIPNMPTNTAPTLAQPQSPTSLGNLTNLLASPLSMDPVSEYQAAASLYEQVKLLNQSLKAIPRFKGYDAFIITVQVTLIPYQRNAAYDAYTDLSFFSGTSEAPAAPTVESEDVPVIFPIITSDELEAASDQQSINKLSSFAFALSAAYQKIGAQAALNQLNQKLNTIAGNNLNSLLTVGKINANTMVVRLGARNSTSKTGLTMVPETHTISFLALAPHSAGELEMISRVALRHADSGKALPNPGAALGQKMIDEFNSDIFGPYLGLKPEEIQGLLGTPQARLNSWGMELAMMNDTTTYSNFPTAFADFRYQLTNYFCQPTNFDQGYVKKHPGVLATATNSILGQFNVVIYDSLWMDAARIQGTGNSYGNDLIPLTHWQPALPGNNQWVLYTDDGQSAATFSINGGKNISLAAAKMSAVLTLTNGVSTNMVLVSDQVQVSSGNDVKVSFPSPASFASGPAQLDVILDQNTPTNLVNTYSHFALVKTPPSAPPPAWSIARTYGVLTAGASNLFSIVLKANSTNTAYLDIENPMVLSWSPTNGVVTGQVNGLFALQPSANTMVTFMFGPLLAGQTVTFNLLDQTQKPIGTPQQQYVYPSGSSAAPAGKAGGQ